MRYIVVIFQGFCGYYSPTWIQEMLKHLKKTLGVRLCTLELLMSDNKIFFLFAYFLGKLNFNSSFTDVENAQRPEQSEMDAYIYLAISDDRCHLRTSFMYQRAFLYAKVTLEADSVSTILTAC